MAMTKTMEAAANKMEAASTRMRELREGPFTPGNLKDWLEALTDYALALGEVQEYSQQSIHEKLQALARQLHRPDVISPKRSAG
jgi:hypothetical protein